MASTLNSPAIMPYLLSEVTAVTAMSLKKLAVNSELT